jgi:hypothetical protein
MLRATLNETIPLAALVSDGNTGLYPRTTVLNSSLSTVDVLYPTHATKGLYSCDWTPAAEGYYMTVVEFFLDALHTVPASAYPNGGESIEVTSDKTNILRILGLNHENAVLDNQTYDGARRLTSARLRAYDSAANAALAGLGGLLFEWTVAAAYDSQSKATLFKINRVT